MTLARRKLVAGNWKMNAGRAFNQELLAQLGVALSGFDGADVAVCVPAPYLAQVGQLVAGSPVALGAQTLSEHTSGAYTG